MENQANVERRECLSIGNAASSGTYPEEAAARSVGARWRTSGSLLARCFPLMVRGATGIFVLLIIGLFVELFVNSLPAIRQFGLSFLWSSEWNPVTEHFGALPFIFGTVVSSLIALVLAAAFGIL